MRGCLSLSGTQLLLSKPRLSWDDSSFEVSSEGTSLVLTALFADTDSVGICRDVPEELLISLGGEEDSEAEMQDFLKVYQEEKGSVAHLRIPPNASLVMRFKTKREAEQIWQQLSEKLVAQPGEGLPFEAGHMITALNVEQFEQEEPEEQQEEKEQQPRKRRSK